MIEKEDLVKEQHDYYSKTFILFEIVKQLKNREFACLNSKVEPKHIATRLLYATSVNYLKTHLDNLGITRGDKLINLYRSNASFKNLTIPVSTYNLAKRTSEENYVKFFENFNDNVDSFDFIIDIDTDSILEAHSIAISCKAIFDNRKVPYYIQFSGRRGFHLIIPYYYMPKMDFVKLVELIKNVLENIAIIFNFKDKLTGELKYIDLSVTNHKGLIKVAYSYDSGNVVLPLDDKQLFNFNPEMVKLENVLKSIKIKDRGLLIRTHNLTEEELKQNVVKFLDIYNF